MFYKRLFVLGLFLGTYIGLWAQSNPDKTYDTAIHTILIHPLNEPLAVPAIELNATHPLQISFDDFKASYQDYYYSIELMNADWTTTNINAFDYVQGFNQIKINDFSVSSIAFQHYFHYQFNFPNTYLKPTRSGNYILKVYKNGNSNELVFTKRFYVMEHLIGIAASVKEPFDGNISKTHQKIVVQLDVKQIPSLQSDQLQLLVVQNYRYNDGIKLTTPNFIRGNILEYSQEDQLVFPSSKECRWLNLQSMQLVSDRISKFQKIGDDNYVFLKPDGSRAEMAYYTFNDLNGNYLISNTDGLQSETQNDYAHVTFTYISKDHIPLVGQKLYLAGALTNNELNKNAEMVFDAKLGVYQKTLLLKQGYYSYNYILRDRQDPNPLDDFTETEGNHWETENNYTIFVYYRLPGGQHDSLLGFTTINSKQSW
jgi:Domain of unknown function (DUF5103)